MVPLPQGFQERVTRVLGVAPRSARRAQRGFSQAGRFLLHLEDGTTCFLKQATDAASASGLRDEMRIYGEVRASFLPQVRAYDDQVLPWLFLEDLSGAAWPPPWEDGQLARLLAVLAQLSRTPVPQGVPALPEAWARTTGWADVAADPRPLLSTGVCDEGWLQRALPVLLDAADPGLLGGEALVHMDLRGDNLCFTPERTVLLDWNWACRGDPLMDLALLAPSLHADGGPPPEALLPCAPGLAALVSGLLGSRAGLPEDAVPPGVRREQRRQLLVALPWAARALGLPPPGGAGRAQPAGQV